MANHESNYPTERMKRELQNKQGFVGDTVRSIMEISKGTKPRNEEELQARIADYFSFCADNDFKPGIESLALSLGVDRTTFWRWCNGENGVSAEWCNVCKVARQGIVAFIEACANSGHLSPPIAIFSLKNLANWKDTVSFEDVSPSKNDGKPMLSLSDLPLFSEMESSNDEKI